MKRILIQSRGFILVDLPNNTCHPTQPSIVQFSRTYEDHLKRGAFDILCEDLPDSYTAESLEADLRAGKTAEQIIASFQPQPEPTVKPSGTQPAKRGNKAKE